MPPDDISREEKIGELARQLWQAAGAPAGQDLEFWLRAEAQLPAPPVVPPVTPAPTTLAPVSLPPVQRVPVQPVPVQPVAAPPARGLREYFLDWWAYPAKRDKR